MKFDLARAIGAGTIPTGWRELTGTTVYTDGTRIVVTGSPNAAWPMEPARHNCDVAGCLSEHVLATGELIAVEPEAIEVEKPKPKCARCDDTGLYDACCRPHRCSCEAGERLGRPTGYAHGSYGDYPPLGRLGRLGRLGGW